MEELEYESCVRGYHIYRSVWNAMPEEIFPCSIEEGNTKDRYVVSIVKRDMDVIGHVPRKISAACCIFIRRGGSISCKVTSKCRYSHDLPQGGLEVPCILTFKGTDSEMMKLKKLLNTPCSQNSVVDRIKRKQNDSKVQQDGKPSKICNYSTIKNENYEDYCDDDHGQPWLQFGNRTLDWNDKKCLLNKEELTDKHKHIDFAQTILKATFSKVFFKYRIKVLAFLFIPDIEISKISKKLIRLLLNLIIATPWLTKIISCQGLGSLLLTQDILLCGYFNNAFPL